MKFSGDKKRPHPLLSIVRGVAPGQQWVRLSAYGGMCEPLCAFLVTLEGGFGFVESSNISHNRPLRTNFDGALAVKVEEGCNMRVLPSCTQWREPPQPQWCENCLDLSGHSDKKKCFITAQVHAVHSMQPCTPQCSERLPVELLDLHGSIRSGAVFPPLCHHPLWQAGSIVNIMGCTVSMQHHSITVSSDSCICRDENLTPQAFVFHKVHTTTW